MPRKTRGSGESSQLPAIRPESYGYRRNGEAFDKARRDRFLQLMFEGASKLGACRLTPVARSTVDRWIEDGDKRASAESAEFAEYYWAALEFGNHEIDRKLAACTDPFVLLQIKKARDSRYGDLDLKRERQRFEIDAAKERHAIEMDAKREDLESKRLRNAVLAAAVEKVQQGGEGASLAFGLAEILDPSFGLSESAAREVTTQAIAHGMIVVESSRAA